MRITLRQLEYFIATGETGSIKLASERVNISQPAISTAISQLEGELGAQLFVRRHTQGLTLTATGRQIPTRCAPWSPMASATRWPMSGRARGSRWTVSP